MVTVLEQLEAGVAGLAGGLLSGFFGVGGNVVLVPLLALALRLPQHEAQGLTLAALLPPLGAPAVWQYQRQGVALHWRVVGPAMVGFLLCVPLGSLVAQALPAAVLQATFAGIVLLAARRAWNAEGASTADDATLPPLSRAGMAIALASGAGSGFASGLLGIGGAIILIPVLTGVLKLTQRQAQLASLAMLLPPLGLPAVVIYVRGLPDFPFGVLGPVAVGFTLGAWLGAKLSNRLSPRRLSRGFALLLLASAVGLLASALGAR